MFCLRRVFLSAMVLSAALASFAQASAADWSGWRGADRSGVAHVSAVPAKWPAKLQRGWLLNVGIGHASPVVAGDRIYQFSRDADRETLRAISLTGEEIWRQSYDAPYRVNSAATGHGKGPKSTPVVAGERIFTLGIDGIFQCRRTGDGKLLWQASRDQLPSGSPLYGAATSPLLTNGGERVIVHLGRHDTGALCAFNTADGKLAWSWTEDGPAYTSPVLMELAGVPQIVTQSQNSCMSLSLAGELLWKFRFKTNYDQNSVTPVQVDDTVIVSGFQKGTTAYRVAKPGEEWHVDEAWHNDDVSMYMSSPIVAGSRLFGFSEKNKGQLFCLNAADGKTVWLGPPRSGENAALVGLGKSIAALTTDAKLTVFAAAGDKFQPQASYEVAESPTWAHPVFIAGGVLIKDETKLTMWKLP